MPWLARLDAKAHRWPLPARWSYIALKWYLIALGAFLMFRMSLHRTGIWPFY